jgi:periplasmic copper chaperone A
MRLRTALIAAATAALVLAPAVAAHVTLYPDKVPADSFQRFSFQVPVELDSPTTKLKVQLPVGLTSVAVEPKPGWTWKTTMEKLAKPVTIEGETITERVATIEWSGGSIKPGEFDEFVISAHVPGTPGKTLTMPAVQTYANGKVVHWIGALTADEPAPHVTLEPAESETSATTTTTASSATSDDDGDDHDGLALGFGIAGLAAGLLALGLTLARRRGA